MVLQTLDCPDRHLIQSARELVTQEVNGNPDSKITVLLPRRTYAPLIGRLLHDRTADKMANAISRIHGVTAQILVYDIASRIARAETETVDSHSLHPS